MASSTQPQALYEGEKLEAVGDAPTLIYFARGSDPEKPLVVFIPGAFHLARIAYGGHEGCRHSDFLAHWIQKAGYSFLALSYPLECTPPIMPATRPDFTVREWGTQAAEATKRTIEQMSLSNRNIVLLFWSMAGKILQPYTLEARSRGLNVELAISLVATPALRGLREQMANITASANGYAFSSAAERYFLAQLREQNSINGGTEIIPNETYVHEYMGNFPITMGAFGLRWTKEEGKFVEDKDAGFEAAEEVGLWDLPFLGAITGDSPLDFRHSVADRATWGFLITYQLMGAVNKLIPANLSPRQNSATLGPPAEELRRMLAAERSLWMSRNPEKAKKIMNLIQETVATLCVVVQGNHHLFIGETGAEQTVDLVMDLQERIKEFKAKISSVLTA